MTVKHLPYHIDEHTNRFEYYENHWKRRGLELLLRHCDPTKKTLLDYGCGRGECLNYAAKAGFTVLGTDIDPECVNLSARYGPTCQLDVRDPAAQFGPKSFDVVTCFHVLEHAENPRQVLSAIAKISRQYVVLAVPNLHSLSGFIPKPILLSSINEGHLQSWDHTHLLNLAERHCGLKLIEWGTDATILPFFSNWSQKLLGTKSTIRFETGLFRRLFPRFGISVLGLFSPVA